MNVTARVMRADGWWAVEVPEVPGALTQARRLEQVPELVADAVAMLLDDVEPGDVEVSVDHPYADAARVLAKARADAEEAAEDARRVARELAVDLTRREGITVRDAGTILHVSPQRVSQLVRSHD